jgi:hypothetical protein
MGKIMRGRMNTKADEIRIRYLYRHLILRGMAKVSFESARRLVGPDCAYHLYSAMGLKKRKTRD